VELNNKRLDEVDKKILELNNNISGAHSHAADPVAQRAPAPLAASLSVCLTSCRASVSRFLCRV
jgi:hypothetical protein